MDDHAAKVIFDLVARQYSLGNILRIRPVKKGSHGRSFELLTLEKSYLLLLLPSGPGEPDSVPYREMGQLLRQLVRRSFPVPLIHYTETHDLAVRTDGGAGEWIQLYDFPDGAGIAPGKLKPRQAAEIGLKLAWGHQILSDLYPDCRGGRVGWLANIPEQRRRLRRLRRQVLAEDTNEQAKELAATLQFQDLALEVLEPTRKIFAGFSHQRVHGDPNLDAFLFGGSGTIVNILDWTRTERGLPVLELAETLMNCCTDSTGRLEANAARSMVAAYCSMNALPARTFRRMMDLWLISQLGGPPPGDEPHRLESVVLSSKRLQQVQRLWRVRDMVAQVLEEAAV